MSCAEPVNPDQLVWPRGKVERAIFAELDLSVLYGIGPASGPQVRLGVTRDLTRQFKLMQIDAWRDLAIHAHVFVASDELARRLKDDLGHFLKHSGRHVIGDWYSVPTGLFRQCLIHVSHKIGIPVLTHDQMMAKIAAIRERRIARIAAS